MKQIAVFTAIGLTLAGCSEATRTVYVPAIEERTISGERAPLVLPPDYRNPTLRPPKEDTVLSEYQKNNFSGQINSSPLPPRKDLTVPKDMRTTPVPPRRPCSIGNTPGCERGR